MNKTLIFRSVVTAVAVFYCLRFIFLGDFEHFAGPFRYLTIWGLFLATFAHSRTLLISLGRSEKRWDGFIGAAAIVNAMVVILYWRLYFADPMSVTSDGALGAPWLEYYLHGVGPLLLWIDALFLHRGFRRLVASALWLLGIIAAYVAWAELVVQRFATFPTGTVTSGLPYRFLNNLEFDGRANFYVTNFIVAVVLLVIFACVAWVIRRIAPKAP